MNETPLTPEQRAAVAEQIGEDQQPATSELIVSFAKSVADMRGHEHGAEDWFCLNLAAYMGEKAAPVLRRLLDAETDATRYRTAWRLARQRARATGGAADRYAERFREMQEATQDSYFALIGIQIERRGMADEIENLLGEYESDSTSSAEFCRALRQMISRGRESSTLPERCPSNVPTGRGDDQAYWCALHAGHDVRLHQDCDGHVWTERDAEERNPGRLIADPNVSEGEFGPLPVCTDEAARAAGLDVAPSPAELTACAETILTASGGAPSPEVDLARAVPLMAAEIERLRTELAARPTPAAVLREAAPELDAHCEKFGILGVGDRLCRMADAAERDDAGKDTREGESTRRPLLDPRSYDAPVQRAAARDLNRERTERGDPR